MKVIYFYIFASSKGDKTYQTLVLENGTVSCDCPGWTKRCVGGVRTCKHTRLVEAGCGQQHCLKFIDKSNGKSPWPAPATSTLEPAATGVRRFKFED